MIEFIRTKRYVRQGQGGLEESDYPDGPWFLVGATSQERIWQWLADMREEVDHNGC